MIFFAYWEPVAIFTLINVILVTGLYVTAMSGQLSLATAAIAGIAELAQHFFISRRELPGVTIFFGGKRKVREGFL